MLKQLAQNRRPFWLLGLAAALTVPAGARPTIEAPGTFITLGTMGGPVANGSRSQPANLLLTDKAAILIDAGDGTVQQLAKVSINLSRINAVFLSHLHPDHTAGLNAILALRNQTNISDRLKIYGPPGTKIFVTGLLSSMKPAAAAGYGIPGQPWTDPLETAEVSEIVERQVIKVEDVEVTATENTHYDFPAESAEAAAFKSFAFRFQSNGRVIVYTGDTGPSAAVMKLAKGADLLVSEMIDVDATLATVARNSPNMPAPARQALIQHLSRHHLSPEEVGKLAQQAGVSRVVITHFAGGTQDKGAIQALIDRVKLVYSGEVTIANDLNQF